MIVGLGVIANALLVGEGVGGFVGIEVWLGVNSGVEVFLYGIQVVLLLSVSIEEEYVFSFVILCCGVDIF